MPIGRIPKHKRIDKKNHGEIKMTRIDYFSEKAQDKKRNGRKFVLQQWV